MIGDTIEASFISFGLPELERLEDHFEKQLIAIRARMVRLREQARMSTLEDADLARLKVLSEAVLKLLRKGQRLDEAIEQVAAQSGAPVATVRRYWTDFTKTKTRAQKNRCDNLILELSAMGFTNAQIGERIDMHEKSVSRRRAQLKRQKADEGTRLLAGIFAADEAAKEAEQEDARPFLRVVK